MSSRSCRTAGASASSDGSAARGTRVTVVATRHDPALPREEVLDGVRVVRVPVALRLGKGAISPGFLAAVARETRGAGVLNAHLPMLEAGPVALASSAPVVLTYQCDVSLPPGALNTAQGLAVDASSRLAMARGARFVRAFFLVVVSAFVVRLGGDVLGWW